MHCDSVKMFEHRKYTQIFSGPATGLAKWTAMDEHKRTNRNGDLNNDIAEQKLITELTGTRPNSTVLTTNNSWFTN